MDKKSQPLIFVRDFTTFDIATHPCPTFNIDSQDPIMTLSVEKSRVAIWRADV